MLFHGVPHASGKYQLAGQSVTLGKPDDVPCAPGVYQVTGRAATLIKGKNTPPTDGVMGNPGLYAIKLGSGFLTHATPFRRPQGTRRR